MNFNISVVPADKAKKKSKRPETWKCNIEKAKRYSAKGLPSYPVCQHRKTYQCTLLTMKDIKEFHDSFYFVPDKGKQDAFLLKYTRANPPNKNRQKVNSTIVRTVQFEYSIVNQAGVNLNVCRETFLKVLNITKHRVIGVHKKFKRGHNQVPVETRGGDRKKKLFEDKKDSVIKFITNLKACESHYARGKTIRVYLQSDLNIKKLYRMYCDTFTEDCQVKESYFRTVFNTNFNIGFSAPSVDECSTCLELNHRINFEKDETNKRDLIFKLQIHKKQAKCFFEHLKQKPNDCFMLSFDCQKNLVLPKVSDQTAYYSRQLYCYNLSVIEGLSTDALTPANVYIYTWMENEAKKSSNEVASVVFHKLKTSDLLNYTSVRLVADGCAGQNKNINVLCMCIKWLASHAPTTIKKIELIYPVTGHSFLPADRVFGLIERDLKVKSTIINKEEYYDVFRAHGTVKLIKEDWVPFDWKEEAKKNLKTTNQLHFKISHCRRISLRRTRNGSVVVAGEIGYNLDTSRERTIFKVGKKVEDINPLPISVGIKIKEDKITDVKKLLNKHFGSDWRTVESLQWYSSVIDNNVLQNLPEGDEECECIQFHEELMEENETAVLIAV